MATPFISRAEAERRINAINEALRAGYRPRGSAGTGPAAIAVAADALGMSRNSLTLHILDRIKEHYGIEPDWSLTKPRGVKPIVEAPAAPAAKPITEAPGADLGVTLRKQPMTLEQLAEATKLSRGQVLDALDGMRAAGINVHEIGGKWSVEKETRPAFLAGDNLPTYVSRPDNTFVFGATSDNHLGSKYERLDVLNDLYDRFAARGVDRVFNAGNWIDGEARFNKFDIHTYGMEGQMEYLAANYPSRPGITTYAVAGDDHEGWYGQREGVDVGRYAENIMRRAGRTDWVNLGYMEAHIRLVNANTGKSQILACVHPGGGSSYALSYSIQKIIESLDGGEKPAVGLYGHYHKLWAGNIRNVWCLQTGCFTAATRIDTDKGRVSIKEIKLGDMVWTHKRRLRRVVRLYSRLHTEDMVSMNYGRVGRMDQTLTATPEHPILVERNGKKTWVPIADVAVGDIVFVESSICKATGERIPYWMALSKNANPMDVPGVRDKLSATKGSKKRTRGGSDGDLHLTRDILPFCEKMEKQGWRMVPVGASVIPDAIGIKDGKVVAFETERSTGRLLEFKKTKYEGAPIRKAIDAVEWVPTTERVIQPRSWYEFDEESGLCKVLVVGVERYKNAKPVTVYNFEVDEDNSYIAGRVAVHNCTEDQTPFMRKKKLEAHVGGAIVELEQDPETGAIVGFTPKLIRYFNKGYYNNRWNHGGSVELPERGVDA